jgi:hypothetical protein
MADPLSVAASVIAAVAPAVKATNSLYKTIKRFGRDNTLRRLQYELEDLMNILDSLTQVMNAETLVTKLLQGPINQCTQICSEFEQSIKAFDVKSKTGFQDWTKMEFMRGNVREFIDTIAGYKATIAISLGTVIMLVTKSCHL